MKGIKQRIIPKFRFFENNIYFYLLKMLQRISSVVAVFAATGALAEKKPMVSVALSPAEADGGSFQNFAASESRMESEGLNQLQASLSAALSKAQARIDAAIHGASFLSSRGADEIWVRVADGPSALATGRAEKLENLRSSMESKKIAQAAAEFDALTSVVIGELKSALRGSFLSAGPDSLDVKVKASDIPWANTISLLRGVENSRDISERHFDDKVLSLQVQFLRKLNAMIARSLSA